MMLGLCSRNPLLQDQCQNKITVGPGSLDEFGSGSVFSVIPAQPAVSDERNESFCLLESASERTCILIIHT